MKIYLGLFGCYRTFEKTYKNLYDNLINNNSNFNFDIYINTETIPKYIHKKWDNIQKNYYTEDELSILFKKYYKSNLKKISFNTLEKGFPFYSRIKFLINEYYDNEKEYDLYFFMRIDCIFLEKLDLNNYVNKLDKNMVKLVCRDIVFKDRFDHDRDWDMGIVSKNINNIFKFVSQDFEKLTPNNNELKNIAKIIKCNNIFTKYDLPLPLEIEKQYKSQWHYFINCMIYSFNKLISPLWYEDDFFLCILR